ncbi:hypothetical protein OG738_31740 [Amycolatopsis sp. NBC_01488]|uniref:hypothetical protein n=1 Tax=Amycolatopsis sp. NBC_01488 TaxID=2903563 RepID=UPI002E290227|nr:hypothetical protein [Amycolatopsis sp. NBC_01488]
MATNDRPARLALVAAVVVLLMGAAGFLVQQRFSTSPGGTVTVAGIEVDAPAGTRVSVRPAPEPGVAVPVTRRIGGGADLAFDGGRPVRVRITVPAPPPAGFAPVVITGTKLVPAAYDAATRGIVADLTRQGAFWGGLLDFAALGREVTPDPAPRPDCAGRAASSGGVTVALGEPDPAAPVSPCVTAGDGRASVTLTSNARVPYRLALPPGWPDPTARTTAASTSAVQLFGRPRQRDLLWPGSSVTYDVPFGRLPATLTGRAEPGPGLGVALATAAHRLASLFGLTDAPEPSPGTLTCAAQHAEDRPATVWAGLGPCHLDGGDVVRRFLDAGIAPVTSALTTANPAFAVALTTSRAQRFTQTVDYRPRTGATTSRATGTCGSVSAVSGRHDAYRCTAGTTTYDPCFATGARVVCPTSTAKAVLLTYTGALPAPPQPGGTADPFLLTLEDGSQCAAVADDPAPRFACADGAVLRGPPDQSSPLWTVDGRTVAKAYA